MKTNTIVLLITLILSVAAPAALGEDTHWQNAGGGDWFDDGNWTAGLPLEDDNAYIDNGGTARIDGGSTQRPQRIWVGHSNSGGIELIGGTLQADSIYLGENTGAVGEYAMSGGSLDVSYLRVGNSGQGVFTQTGGASDENDYVVIAYQDGSIGSYTISGSASLTTGNFTIGSRGTGSFVQDGGSVVAGSDFYIGSSNSGDGTYTLNDGSLTAAGLVAIGNSGTGRFVQEGGEASLDSITIGVRENSSGTYTLNDGQLTSSSISLGQYGTGVTASFTQTGGTCATGHLFVKTGNSYTLSGGSLTVTDSAEIAGGFDLDGGSASISIGGIGDFTNMINPGAPTLTVAAESLAYFGAGLDPYATFASITNNGIIHQRGSALTIGPSTTVRGRGNIYDHVHLQGQLMASDVNHSLDILEGLFVSGGGTAHLGRGDVVIENEISGMSGGDMDIGSLYVGKDGTGRFIHSGGAIEGGWLCLGYNSGSSGYYELTGNGAIRVGSVHVGESGTGRFIHNGGLLRGDGSHSRLRLGAEGGDGYYELNSGDVVFSDIYVNSGEFKQNGGYCQAMWNYDDGVFVGSIDGMVGTYRMLHGEIDAKVVAVGNGGEGHFLHSGGTVKAGSSLEIAGRSTGTGTYELGGDGIVLANRMYIGGSFLQDGGTVDVTQKIGLASNQASGALYRISAGSLNVPEMTVGSDSESSGTFDIAGASSDITISEKLTINATGVIRAVPGVAIHMTGSIYENESTDPAALDGLANIELIFEGGAADVDPFEVAGRDLGANWEAFSNNFALGTLTLGGDAGPAAVGRVRLVDSFDNQPDWNGAEALYVKNLQVGSGSRLELNGLNIYCMNFDNAGLIIDGGGAITQVAPIDSISSSNPDGAFSPTGGDYGLGELTIDDSADTVVTSADGQMPYDNGSVSLTTSLFADNSGDGLAGGEFRGGELIIRDSADADMLICDLISLELRELIDGRGALSGQGVFEITGGNLAEAFRLPDGGLLRITFNIDPDDIDNFAAAFSGAASMTLAPIPEPASLALMAAAGLGLIRRRRSA